MKAKKVWKIAAAAEDLKQEIGAALHISDTLANVLVNRGFTDIEAARLFFQVEEQQFHDPFLMRGMDNAVARIEKAIAAREKITVYGDYDVDGITATSLLIKVLRELGAQVDFYIPERQSEGYGLNTDALTKLVAAGTELLITVDCGISAAAETAAFGDQLDMIITDHHLAPEILPAALVILNPKQPECAYPEKALAGVGVAYKLCQALWRSLRGGAFTAHLDIVALGTIADIVPLLGENRLIVNRGLAVLNQTANLGLRALIAECGLTEKQINAGHVGFMLAPRLNAAGRLDSAMVGVELLITADAARAAELAQKLNLENQERQRIEKEIFEQAVMAVQTADIAMGSTLVVTGQNWNSGVIGIVASRLVEKYYRPTIVISEQDGSGKGSCRSIAGFNMYEALKGCADLLEGFGGHAQAAGLTIALGNIAAFEQRFGEIAAARLTEADYIPVLAIDAALPLAAVTEEFIDELARLEPYGMGNPRPLFACMAVKPLEAKAMGQDGAHLRFKVRQARCEAGGIAWNMGAAASQLQAIPEIDIAFQPEVNEWRGNRMIQLKAQDFRTHEKILTDVDRLFLTAAVKDDYQDIGQAEQFFTKVVGVTFEGRQRHIAALKAGDLLSLARQPENSHDANAIAVVIPGGEQIGFLRAEIAAQLAPLIDGQAAVYEASIASVTGSAEQNFGVNLFVWRQQQQGLFCQRRCAQITRAEVCRQLLGEGIYHRGQEAALDHLAARRNLMVIMGTGRGKSAIFQTQAALLAINENRMTVIVYPLRALVNDQYLSLRQKFEPLGLRVYKGNGTLTVNERGVLFEALQSRSADILLTTPEFIEANFELLQLGDHRVGFFVVDECHHIASHRRPAYKNLSRLLSRLGNPLTLGVTATANKTAAACIQGALSVQEQVIDKTVRENLTMHDGRNAADKFADLRSLLKTDEKVLIFVNSRNKAVEIAGDLRESCPKLAEQIGFYHAGLSNEWRVKVETWFKEGTLQVVVATSAFGEGVDLPDIRHVVLYHLPFDMTSFNQQCGRAGRDGGTGRIHLLFGGEDVKLNQLILKERAPDRDTIGRIYLILKKSKDASNQLICSNVELAERFSKQYRQFIGESGIGSCLKILEELGLISRETFGGVRRIYFNSAPQAKLDLMQSASFVEGVNEREEFERFAGNVLQLTGEELLSWINKPIYPED